MKTEDRPSKQTLVPEKFMIGAFRGWGLIESRFGRFMRNFTVDAWGQWSEEDQCLSFEEVWRFDDRRTDQLHWQIWRTSPSRYRGAERRLVRPAEGKLQGAAFRWRYRRRAQGNGSRAMAFDFDDRFWRIDEQTMIVRADIKRFGISLARLFATYRRQTDEERL